MNKIYGYLAVGLVGFCLGCYYTYTKYVPNLESKILNQAEIITDLQKIIRNKEIAKQVDNTTISYATKTDKSDNDVELTDNSNIKVRYNDTSYTLPNHVQESSKFENGKLVISKENITTFDLTNTVNTLADEKAKQYSRIGKADFGCIYNRKENDLYGGIRYNAKMYDIGYYHNVNGNDWLIGVHYKF